MFQRIVAAYDGSSLSEAAVALALRLSAGTGGHVTLTHVLEVPDHFPEIPETAPSVERLITLVEEEWTARMAALAARAPDDASLTTEVITASRVVPALLDLLHDADADLVVAGTHGTGAVRRLLGSVSQQLLDHAPCSVLLVRDAPVVDPPIVVAAVDGADITPAVIAAGEAAATALDATLVVAHVIDERISAVARIDATNPLHEMARRRGRDTLDAALAHVTLPGDRVDECLREGRPGDVIAGLCAERRARLLVTGTRGLHGFKGMLVGSTARALVQEAPCPVLVVRPPARATGDPA